MTADSSWKPKIIKSLYYNKEEYRNVDLLKINLQIWLIKNFNAYILLVLAAFAQMTASMWCGRHQCMALLRCYGSPCCFDSDFEVVFNVGFGLYHCPPYGVQVRRVKHSNTILSKSVTRSFGTVAGAESYWKRKSAYT